MKQRLDILMLQQNLAESREKAKQMIKSDTVFVSGRLENKAGSMVDENAVVEVKGTMMKYVSRGGLKLEKAIVEHGILLTDKVCMDIGASTGGFSDCMLQNGAGKVFAVDVGTNQLAKKLRANPRVVSMEKTNIRYVTLANIKEYVDFVSIDLSFISLTKVLAPVYCLMKPNAQIVCLVKPQFEAGRENIGKNGIVRKAKVHEMVIRNISQYSVSVGFELLHLDFSPIKGSEGNIEYLLHMIKRDAESREVNQDIGRILEQVQGIVYSAHKML